MYTIMRIGQKIHADLRKKLFSTHTNLMINSKRGV